MHPFDDLLSLNLMLGLPDVFFGDFRISASHRIVLGDISGFPGNRNACRADPESCAENAAHNGITSDSRTSSYNAISARCRRIFCSSLASYGGNKISSSQRVSLTFGEIFSELEVVRDADHTDFHIEIWLRACSWKLVQNIVIRADVIDLVQNNENGPTNRLKVVVEFVEDPFC